MAATEQDDRLKALTRTLADIERAFGKGSIMKLGDRMSPSEGIEVISTGSIALDAALGVGGVPKGRVVEVYGPEASGKTTLALHMVAQAQKKGGARRLHRRRTRPGPRVRPEAGRRCGESLHQSARQRRTGP